MKLSKLTTDEAINVLVQISPYVSNITGDKSLMDTLSEKLDIGSDTSVAEVYAYGSHKISQLIPIIFQQHKEDVYEILAAVNKKTKSEISKQNIIETMTQIKLAVKDKELMNFFKSLGQEDESE